LRVEKSVLDRALDFSNSPNDFQLIIDREIEGQVGDEKTFKSGLLVGRLYVWDHVLAAVVCAARVAATNSDELNWHSRPGVSEAAIIKSDLRAQALAQAKERLFVAGPPVPEGTDEGPRDGSALDDGAKRKLRDAGPGKAADAG